MTRLPPKAMDELYDLRAEVRRVERSARILKQRVARIVEAAENTNDSPKEGTRNDERSTRS